MDIKDTEEYKSTRDLLNKITMKQETLEEAKDLTYWRKNAEEDYIKVPISVLRYITELEERMYSEEEVIEIAKDYAKRCQAPIQDTKWFDRFKKSV